jgi:hypothetical protein
MTNLFMSHSTSTVPGEVTLQILSKIATPNLKELFLTRAEVLHPHRFEGWKEICPKDALP